MAKKIDLALLTHEELIAKIEKLEKANKDLRKKLLVENDKNATRLRHAKLGEVTKWACNDPGRPY